MAVDICVCTYKRESLSATLESLDQQVDTGHDLRIIVIDNDETPSAQARVEACQAKIKTPIKYVHAPARNISIARNAALDASDADWLAFVDDDEYAPSDWLSKMIQTAEDHQFDIVFGPVLAEYKPEDPVWIQSKNYHSAIPEYRFGEVESGPSGNVLLRSQHPVIRAERFLLEKGRTGGEDTEYFNRVKLKGLKLGIAETATLYEPVADHRLSFSWLASRKYRTGMTYGRHVALDSNALSRAHVFASASAKIVLCFLAAACTAILPTHRNFWALRGIFHSGVFSAAMGRTESEHY